MSDILPGMTMPCLIYDGDADPIYQGIKEGAEHIPNARFVSLPALDHGQGFRNSQIALPHIKKFLAEVSQSLGLVVS